MSKSQSQAHWCVTPRGAPFAPAAHCVWLVGLTLLAWISSGSRQGQGRVTDPVIAINPISVSDSDAEVRVLTRTKADCARNAATWRHFAHKGRSRCAETGDRSGISAHCLRGRHFGISFFGAHPLAADFRSTTESAPPLWPAARFIRGSPTNEAVRLKGLLGYSRVGLFGFGTAARPRLPLTGSATMATDEECVGYVREACGLLD